MTFLRFLMVILTLSSVSVVHANDEKTQHVKDLIKKTLPNTKIDRVDITPSESLYAIYAGSNVFYFDPVGNVLFFGEMYSLTGGNITEEQRGKAFENVLNEHINESIVINPDAKGHTVVEFTSPNCGYCQRYEHFIRTSADTKRIVFFVPTGNPGEDEKLNHVLCSKTAEEDMKKLYDGTLDKLTTCEAGVTKLASHRALAKKLGVVGTPLLFVDKQKVDGFKPEILKSLLKI